MIARLALERVLENMTHGALRVKYWNGQTKLYGIGAPYNTLIIKHPKVLRAILRDPSLGLGEAYMNGDLEVEGGIDQLLRLGSENKESFGKFTKSKQYSRRQSNVKHKQKRHIKHHYDIGNDFYKLWLDKKMIYSCAYFRSPLDSLELAQQQKLDHILKKLQLKPGQTLLDIGCGWGDLALKAARQYKVQVTGITLSEEQYKHAKRRAKEEGLSERVKFQLLNYQDIVNLGWQFDRIVSVGMYEHVGRGNQADYFRAVKSMLKSQGLTVLHTITQQASLPTDSWIERYIFPGGYLPTLDEVLKVSSTYGFRLTDYENLRLHYAMTLDEWLKRFESKTVEVESMFDERFVRMWRYYLSVCSGSFRYGTNELSQFVFSNDINNELPLTRDFLYR